MPSPLTCQQVQLQKNQTAVYHSHKLLVKKWNFRSKNQSVGGTKPAILSLIPPYSDNYVPRSSVQNFPEPLISLYASYYVDLEYHELLNACETIFSLHVTEKMAKSVEKATKSQSKSNLWFKHQPGQVTASHMRLSVVQILQIPRKV